MPQPPETCADMTELRRAIDALDGDIMRLLALRARYIDRAAELKPAAKLPARIETRVLEVLARARENATASGFDPDLAEDIWRRLIDWSIAREEAAMAATEGDSE